MDDFDCKWGNMPPQDIPGQLTRSMLEMRKPKAYEAKSLISNLENKSYAMYSYANQIADLSMPPPFQRTHSHKGKSEFSEPGIGTASHALFVAPELDNQFRDGTAISSLPTISQDMARSLLKGSVQSIAAHAGYEEMTTSCLNGLTGITRNFLESFSKCLRGALDCEAETGRTPFYDVLDQALNDSGTKSFKDLQQFWNLRVVQRHKNLEKQAMALAKEVRSLSYRVHEVDVDAAQVTHNKFGKWTPVAGMRSGSDVGRRRDPAVAGSKQSIKSEHRDFSYKDVSDPFTERKPSQDNPFHFDDCVDSDFGLGKLDNHNLPKRPRNAL